MFLVAFCGFAGDLLFLSAIRKKKITKRRVVEDLSEKRLPAAAPKLKNRAFL